MDRSHSSIPKRKVFPIRPRAPWLDRVVQSCAVILAINWVFQGMRGMQPKELTFRVAFGLTLAAITAMMTNEAGLDIAAATTLGLLTGHTANFLLNGQFWVCARYCRSYRGDAERIVTATVGLARELATLPWLDEVVFIGSRARGGRPSDRSDIDLRLVFPPGIVNWWRVNVLMLRLRMGALRDGLPLDLYAYDSPDALLRFDQDEPLLLAKDTAARLRRMFAARAIQLDSQGTKVA